MPGHGFNFIDLLWFYLIVASLLPVIQRRRLEFQRLSRMRALEKQRGSRLKNDRTCARRSCLRKTVAPSASTPCT